jgi:hypothetical protein
VTFIRGKIEKIKSVKQSPQGATQERPLPYFNTFRARTPEMCLAGVLSALGEEGGILASAVALVRFRYVL